MNEQPSPTAGSGVGRATGFELSSADRPSGPAFDDGA